MRKIIVFMSKSYVLLVSAVHRVLSTYLQSACHSQGAYGSIYYLQKSHSLFVKKGQMVNGCKKEDYL